jgi:hypothetical protein
MNFDSIFMILSYSLDGKQLPLDILFFNFDVFIIKLYGTGTCIIYDFFSPDLVAEFIPKTWHIWDKWSIFFKFFFQTISVLDFCQT